MAVETEFISFDPGFVLRRVFDQRTGKLEMKGREKEGGVWYEGLTRPVRWAVDRLTEVWLRWSCEDWLKACLDEVMNEVWRVSFRGQKELRVRRPRDEMHVLRNFLCPIRQILGQS